MLWTDHKIKILSGLLFVSLAVNFGLVSFMAGRHTGNTMLRQQAGAMMDVVRSLPREQRKTAVDIVRQHRPALQKAMAAVREQRDTIRVLASKDQVDRTALKDAFTELRHRTEAAQAESQALALELLPQIPPAQRKELLEKQGKLMP